MSDTVHAGGIEVVAARLRAGTPFALLRFGDGEASILWGHKFRGCIRRPHLGFTWDPERPEDQEFRERLLDAMLYDGGPDYLVGLPLGQYRGAGNKALVAEWARQVRGTVVRSLLFVPTVTAAGCVIGDVLPLMQKFRRVLFVGNVRADVAALPFPVAAAYPVSDCAWRSAGMLPDALCFDLAASDERALVVVAAGPYSKVLIHHVWQRTREHTLMDVGSVFDRALYGVVTRHWQRRR